MSRFDARREYKRSVWLLDVVKWDLVVSHENYDWYVQGLGDRNGFRDIVEEWSDPQKRE